MGQSESSTAEIISEVVNVGEMTPEVRPYLDRASGREYIDLHFPPETITKAITAAHETRVEISEKSPTFQGDVLGKIKGPVKIYVLDYHTPEGDERLNKKAASYNPDTGAVTGVYSERDEGPRFPVSVVIGENLPQFKNRAKIEHKRGGVDVIELPEAKFRIDTQIRVEKEKFDPETVKDLGRQALNNTLRHLTAVVKEGIVYYSR